MMGEINASTRLCAVLGWPIHHSASPAMHNAAIEHLGLNWRYVAFATRPEELSDTIRGAKTARMVGLNLTVPHKLLALDLVDVVDETARRWGAVNTILFEALSSEGKWLPLRDVPAENALQLRSVGYNTDADAIVRSIQEDLAFTLRGSSVLLLGAGGAGRAAALRLAAEGVEKLFLVNRTMAKCEELAAFIRADFPACNVVVGYPKGRVGLVLNATSAGLKPADPLPFERTEFDFVSADAAYDMIYRPARTRFLEAAAEAGLRNANGLGMLLYQGAKAFEIWSGMIAPVEVMRQALLKQIYGSSNPPM